MSNKIFENANAKRLFVSLYEETPEKRQATFGQNIRDLFDHKITDLERIEGFYLNEADVQTCHDAAMKTPEGVQSEVKTEVSKEDFSSNEESTGGADDGLPKNW